MFHHQHGHSLIPLSVSTHPLLTPSPHFNLPVLFWVGLSSPSPPTPPTLQPFPPPPSPAPTPFSSSVSVFSHLGRLSVSWKPGGYCVAGAKMSGGSELKVAARDWWCHASQLDHGATTQQTSNNLEDHRPLWVTPYWTDSHPYGVRKELLCILSPLPNYLPSDVSSNQNICRS